MSGIASTIFAVAMIAAIVLAIAGVKLALKREERQRGLLMVAAAIVILANVLIWTI
jgi:hypothetical protein